MLDLRRLRVLRAIAREGSMAGAARALDYTQPAIGHHVRRLEAEVGAVLVVRDGRGVRLTPAGAALAARADTILAGVEAAHEEVAAIAGLREGRVRLVAFPSGSATIVPAALAALTKRYPGLEVTLAEAEPPESLELLRAGECDVALAFEYPGVEVDEGSGLVKRPLAVDPLLAVLPADHPLAGQRRVDLRRLRDATWIAGCPRCRGHLVHLCEEAGFAPRIAYATDDHVAVQAMVGAGLGVALLPGLVLDVVRRDDVAVRPVTRSPTRTVTAVTTEGAVAVPAVAALLTTLAEVAATRAPARAAA
jgi:DNA-binding transcriptional LysR family regulator